MGRRGLTGNATRYIAGELAAQKARNGWSLDDIEARTGVPRSTVDRALNGDHTLAVETLVQLCAGMGLDVVQLIRSGGVPPYMLTRRSRAGCRFGLNPLNVS